MFISINNEDLHHWCWVHWQKILRVKLHWREKNVRGKSSRDILRIGWGFPSESLTAGFEGGGGGGGVAAHVRNPVRPVRWDVRFSRDRTFGFVNIILWALPVAARTRKGSYSLSHTWRKRRARDSRPPPSSVIHVYQTRDCLSRLIARPTQAQQLRMQGRGRN